MAKYSVLMQRTADTTLAVGTINAPGSGMRRVKVYDFMFGSEATPANNAFLWRIQRTTTAGTSTAVTPQPLDSADPASVTVAGSNTTVNPSLTASAFLLDIPLNQQASFRWVAAPGSELVIPATASNGVAVLTPTASAVNVSTTVLFDEQ